MTTPLPEPQDSAEEDPASYKRVLVSRFGAGRVPHLAAFLPEAREIAMPLTGIWPDSPFLGTFDAVAGWRRRRSRAVAAQAGVPYIAMEDGFLRSFDLGVAGAPPLSLVVDKTGMYYDASAPSDLENILNVGDITEAERQRAAIALDWLRAEKLSKYNKGLHAYDGVPIKRLIIDQTAGDASVLHSGQSEDVFEKMIADALATYAARDVAVKLHPDTMQGKKAGYLRDLAQSHGLRLIDTPCNPWDLMATVDEVATLSSQLGFEALMAGKKVICYGLPFYAGWGVTEDKLPCPRRTAKRDVVDIFAAAYLRYARYVDPFTGKATTLEETIGYLSDLKRHESRTAAFKGAEAAGFSPWKRHFIPRFIGSRPRFVSVLPHAKKADREVIVWGLKQDKTPYPVVRMEDGFIRSRGLGAKLVRPWSLVMDTRGIYFDPRQPSDLEHILQHADMSEGLLQRAAKLREMLVKHAVSKYNTGKPRAARKEVNGRRVILVPGQVEDDASIRVGTQASMNTNLALLQTVRQSNPDAYVIYKPHPDVEAGKRRGAIPRNLAFQFCDDLAEGTSIASLWPEVDAVYTLTSLTGFEGLLRGKDVHVFGRPFYAGWGLTTDYADMPRRTRLLTLDALVAGVIVLYPFYFDWQTRSLTTPETVIRRLARAAVKQGEKPDGC